MKIRKVSDLKFVFTPILFIKRILIGVGLLLLILLVGCSDSTGRLNSIAEFEGNVSIKEFNDNILSDENNNIVSSNSSVELENDKSPIEKNYNTTKEEAIKIAFEEAKKHEDEYNLIMGDDTISDYTCEIRQKDGIVFYDIIFKNLSLKNRADDIKTQIGIWVDVDSGEIIKVLQYK